ncbi:MAG: CPBP family intramembrane metalloprotease [Candidatus Taylorbacteria bacterium]|nr:CPBP family intramembrane metalloprotease [Candidatus Taylorbacteria bacterium]
MDPPKKFEFHLDSEGLFWWKLKMTSLVFWFNSIVALLLMTIAYYTLDEETIFQIVREYANNSKLIFGELNWTNFLLFSYYYCILSPVTEELIYRYPIILLLKKNFSVKLWSHSLTKVSILLIILLLNSLWGYSHIWTPIQSLQKNYYHLIPPFLVGFPLYWLVIKTRTLWPAILCHGALNFSLYFLVQLMIYLEFNPVSVIALLFKALRAIQPVP